MNELENIINEAYSLFQNKRYGESLSKLSDAETYCGAQVTSEWKISIENMRGFVLIGLKQLDEARLSFENALHLDEKSSQACAGLGEIFYLGNKDQEAKTMFEYAVFNNPQNAYAVERLSKINKTLGLPEWHNSLYVQYELKDNGYKDTVVTAGLLFGEGKFQESIESINAVEGNIERDLEELVSLLTEVCNLKGVSYLNLKHLEEARIAFERALNLDPQSSTACWGLGEVFFFFNQYEEAKTMYEWALKIDENNPAAKVSLLKTLNAMNAVPANSETPKAALKLASGRTIEING
ncbi:MAG: tetratricopeptide repeat protein [Syntrophothermus sp.]